MKNFSELNIQTTKERLVNYFAKQSGLDKEFCSKLYEDYNMQFAGDSVQIAEKFKSLLSTNLNKTQDIIGKFFDKISSEPKNAKEYVNDFLDTFCSNEDDYNFYKVILAILYLKDSVNFKALSNVIGDVKELSDETLNHLNESFGIDPNGYKEGAVPKLIGVNDGCSIEEDIAFYGDLKNLLARNNKRWGHNYHLVNVHKAIIDYLEKEIEYLTTKDNITTVDQNFEEILLKQLLFGELNVMYRDINVLRPLIVDIQTLIFDMMCLTMTFIKQNQRYLQYLNRKEFDDVIGAFNALYEKISSSQLTSLLLVKPDDKIQKNFPVSIIQGLEVDYSKYDIYLQPLKVVAIVDALYIMKSCSSEFNLKIRPLINLFVTKAFNVVGRIEHIILEDKKINKYKTVL